MNDTIVALATPPGTSALAVIRLSGPDCHKVWTQFLSSKTPVPRVAKLLPFQSQGETLDQILAIFFAAPASFTGEDSIELFPHGNMLLVKKIIHALIETGFVRMAEPGEFTRRAFEHGQIDLIQAESIGMLIHSRNEKALENAQKLLKGELSHQIKDLVDKVQYLSAKMELEVDFAEEEADAELDLWSLDIIQILELIDTLKEGHIKGRKKSEIPMVVLYGQPNAGKSSLVNALLEEDRLLVSQTAGTTRDYIETSLYLRGGEIRLVDTAGLGEAVDHLDELSQEKTRQIVEKAHLRLHLVDSSTFLSSDGLVKPFTPDDICIYTKQDLLEANSSIPKSHDHAESILVSSASGFGLSGLKDFLNRNIFEEDDIQEEVWMASERQFQCLIKAENILRSSLDVIALGHTSPEILAFELREARLALEEITGEISVDSILGRIFEGFCIGK